MTVVSPAVRMQRPEPDEFSAYYARYIDRVPEGDIVRTLDEQIIETLAHEIGHVFGLRHFFAKVSESAWPSEIFGTHSKFTIMNYGSDSRLTKNDRSDLEALYTAVWDGIIEDVNRTPVVQVRPYHELRAVRHTVEGRAEVVKVAATDPLNLVGILSPGPRVPSIVGNAVLWVDGHVLASYEAGQVVVRAPIPPGARIDDELTYHPPPRPVAPSVQAALPL